MEALVAVGFAANILNFVDYVCHALKIGNQLRRNGMSDSNADLEKSVTLLEHQMDKIRIQCGQTTGDAGVDESLGKLAAECIAIAQDIKGFVEKFKLDRTKTATLQKVPEKLQQSQAEIEYERLKRCKAESEKWTNYLKRAPPPLTEPQETEKSELEARRANLQQMKKRNDECKRSKIHNPEPYTDKHETELRGVEKRHLQFVLQKKADDDWKARLRTKVAPPPFTDNNESKMKTLRKVIEYENSKFESERIAIQEANKKVQKSSAARLAIKTLAKAVESEWNKPKVKELVEKLERIRSLLYSEVMLGIQRTVKDIQKRSENTDRLLEELSAASVEHRKNASGERKHSQRVIETLLKSQHDHLLQIDDGAKERHDAILQAIDSFKTCLESQILFPTLPQMITRRDPSLQSAAFYGYEAIEAAVLATLQYRKMEAREAQVHDAHEKTCKWIFKDPNEHDRPWSNFRLWLEQGIGCYWIEGKAGCGKSTLMKFLRLDRSTQSALEKWSEPGQCIMASCFFWKAGTDLQKNQEGLLRSLLHTILSQRRELISQVFPGLYNTLMSQVFQDNSNPDIFFSCESPHCLGSFKQPSQLEEHRIAEHAGGIATDGAQSSGTLTIAELRKAFNLLASQYLNDVKVCLLVDGLDEYEGDQQDVADLFKTITKNSSVKAIISSRPEATFVEAFNKAPKLRMEDLTAPDLELYVRSTLLCHSQMQSHSRTSGLAERLTNRILTRACGVFLWVALVVRSLVQCLSDGSYPEELETTIEAYPPELHELYEHMFARMKPSHRLDAFKLFQAVFIAQGIESEIPTALRLSYFERDKAIDAVKTPVQGISAAQLEDRLVIMQARLRSRCCGLLEIHTDTSKFTETQGSRSAEGRIVFLHRTVSDFLHDPGVRDLLERETRNISSEIYESMMASLIYRFKSRDYYRVKSMAQWKQLAKDIEAFLIYCERSGPVNDEYLEEYNRILTKLWQSQVPKVKNGQQSMGACWAEMVLRERGLKITQESDDHPLLSLLVRYGLLSPAQKIMNSMDSSKNLFFETGGRFIVLRLCFWAMQHSSLSVAYLEIMRSLIDIGFNVNAKTSKRSGGFQSTPWEDLLRLAPQALPNQLSDLVAHCHTKPSGISSGGLVSYDNIAAKLQSWVGLVDLFIGSGADLDMELEPCSSIPAGGPAHEVIRTILTTAIAEASLSSAELLEIEEAKARVERLLDKQRVIANQSQVNPCPEIGLLQKVSSTHVEKNNIPEACKLGIGQKASQRETYEISQLHAPVPAFASSTDPETRRYTVDALRDAGFGEHQISLAIERAGVGYDVAGLAAWILDIGNRAEPGAAPQIRNMSSGPNGPTRSQKHGTNAKARQWAVVVKEASRQKQQSSVVGAQYVVKVEKSKKRRSKKSVVENVELDSTRTTPIPEPQLGASAGAFELASGTFTWFFETNHGNQSSVTFSPEQISQLRKTVQSMLNV